MILTNFSEQHGRDKRRVGAQILWEEESRPPFDLFFEVDAANAEALTCNPNAFLIACFVPAMFHHEKRIKVDGPIQPDLIRGLGVVHRTFRFWYPELFEAISPIVEADTDNFTWTARSPYAGFFFSGGVDSLASLRSNRLALPHTNPDYFREGVFLLGLQKEVDANSDAVHASLQAIAREAGLNFLAVKSNVRLLHDNWPFWEMQWEAGVFAATAHMLKPRFTQMTLASSFSLDNLIPLGSHPLIDPWYGTSGLTIKHDDVSLTRLDKIRLVADWETGRKNLRVCNDPPPGKLNCGLCEKCIRTMLGLLSVGALSKAHSFGASDVTESTVRAIGPLHGTQPEYYPELVEALRLQGRDELARAISMKLRAFAWKQRFKAADKALFHGSVARVRHFMRGRNQSGSKRIPQAGKA
jgi:hypothetical protein